MTSLSSNEDYENSNCLTTAPSSSGSGVEILEKGRHTSSSATPQKNERTTAGPASGRTALDRVRTVETSATEEEEEEEDLHSDCEVNDDDTETETNAEEEYALAACSALVGENVLDSPTVGMRKKARVRLQAEAVAAAVRNGGLLDVGGGADVDAIDGDADAGPRPTSSPRPVEPMTVDRSPNSSAPVSPTRGPASTPSDEMSVGIMAHGLAWAQRQRDRRRRLYLQNQAEQQLRKIREAQMAEKLAAQQEQQEQQADRSSSLSDNPTFQNLVTKALRSFSITGDEVEPSAEDGGDGSAAAEGDSSHDPEGGGGVCTAAVVSQSGDGYSGNIPVSESDEQQQREEEDAFWVPPVRIAEEEVDAPPYILTREQMQSIAVHVLPRGIAYCRWKRLYSLARDGDSFDAFLRLVGDDRKSLVVVRTSKNAVLGGFADMPWDLHHLNKGYYGGSGACLWHVDGNGNHNNNKIVVYPWTGVNRYIQLLDHSHKMLAFGGGEDDETPGSGGSGETGGAHFGLSIEQDFQIGSTGPCATFHNQPLCDQETFEIVDLEIFGFLVGQF